MGLRGYKRSIGTEHFTSLPVVLIDIETTGASLSSGGEICEAGLVKADPSTLDVLDQLDLRFAVSNPEGRAEEALSFDHYNGFTFAEWKNATPPAAALDRLNTFCAGCVPWAYNASFEFQWLDEYYQAYGLDWAGDYHWHCLMSIASETLRPDFLAGRITKLSLSSVARFLGLADEPSPHRGLAGAQLEHQLLKCLRQRRT